MKPGRRRLLIPGLLVALLIVVALSAAIRRADAETTPLPVVPHTQVSVMSDPRITESSGLAASRNNHGIVYTINDSGDKARVFAVDIDTGRVVGVTSVISAKWRDAEAMALWGGKLAVADVGNNLLSRRDAAIYVFDEPGPGNHRVDAARYPVTFGKYNVEVEAMAFAQGRIALITKEWPNGHVFVFTEPLRQNQRNVPQLTGWRTLAYATDATATADGRYVLVRGPVSVEVREARSWKLVRADVIPAFVQGETIAMESSERSYLIGSEGSDSPLVRVGFDRAGLGKTPPAKIDDLAQLREQQPVRTWLWEHRSALVIACMFGGAGLAGAALALWTKRRRHRRRGVEA